MSVLTASDPPAEPTAVTGDRRAQTRRLAGGAIKLFVGTLASRILGFVRMMFMAKYFGGAAAMDVFNIAFMVPNLFRGVLGEQAVESAFLPTFQSLTSQGRVREAWRAASVVLNWLVLALILITALTFIFTPELINYTLAPGFGAEKTADAVFQGRLMCPFLILIGLAAFYGSLLLAHGQNLAYGMAPTLFNAGCIGVLVLFHHHLGPLSMSIGVLVGGVLELLGSYVPIPFGRRQGLVKGAYSLSAGLTDEHARMALRVAWPVFAGSLVTRCASVVDRAIASFLPEGSISALGYALPLVLLPFALFGLSVGRAALVPLSEHAARRDGPGFEHDMSLALRLGLFLLIPLSAGTAVLALPITELLRSGAFKDPETRMTAIALFYYAPSLAGMGLASILGRASYALHDAKAPLRAATLALAFNALLSAALALTPLRHGGIALATSIAMTLEAVLLFIYLKGKLKSLGMAVRLRGLWRPTLRICLATAVMSAAVAAVEPLTRSLISSTAFPARCANVLLPGSVGVLVYGVAMLVLDRRIFLQLLRRKPGPDPK